MTRALGDTAVNNIHGAFNKGMEERVARALSIGTLIAQFVSVYRTN